MWAVQITFCRFRTCGFRTAGARTGTVCFGISTMIALGASLCLGSELPLPAPGLQGKCFSRDPQTRNPVNPVQKRSMLVKAMWEKAGAG